MTIVQTLFLRPAKATTASTWAWVTSGGPLLLLLDTRFPRGPLLLALPEARQAHERLLRRPVDKSGLAKRVSHRPVSFPQHSRRKRPLRTQGAARHSPAGPLPLRPPRLCGACTSPAPPPARWAASPPSSASAPPPPPAIVAPAGPRDGTGTRVYVYEWHINHNDANALPIVLKPLGNAPKKKSGKLVGRAYQRMETEPGLSKLVHNEHGLKKAIEPLLQMAERQIPRHAHKHTPVFLYATAGVRKLPNADSEWLLDKAWDVLKNSSFLCSRDRVKIISGMEEAYYGWIALNHHMNMLGTSSPKMTYGSLDLGGSSLQVTFETGKSVQDETSIGLTIGSVSHQLSAYSLTGYGLNDAFDKSVAHLVKRLGPAANNGKVQVKHPCLQTGYKKDYVCSYCHPVKQDGSPSVGEKTSVNGKLGTTVELVGAPQWNECSALAKVAVNLSEWSRASPGLDCDLHPCALASNFPRPHGQFYAMSGFFVVFKFFNLTADATLIDVLKRGQEFCEKPWKVAKSSVPPQPFIEQYCFRAPYIASLLREGLQIKDNQNTGGSSMLGMGSPLRFQLWSSINTGERIKTPLSPTVAGSDPHPFSITHGLGGSSVQLMESSRQSLGAYHSYSVGSLGQMQFSSGVRNPSRGQTTLQSRRSQSREDLISTLADVHVPKV
ncbi:hypothetical protein PR202_ga05388 [Eleusine coracana subsp. coracana]|uniref:Apyrase 7 n=1 Tax=Eleusine coracana subsp. coracana TaxID=191504 RepID=A0AAV5BT06_ELECO|nr:hypothetical protein PR202_ga04935 [Eleusine coracana subsp. coracana]GJM89221.1 hypothetical protein PR202_ga05388 [Eleusine coracana subsp. coracana]